MTSLMEGLMYMRYCTQPKFAPYTKLPNELLAEIFKLSTTKPIFVYGRIEHNECPWVLLRVCKRWRDIALGTSFIWNDIHVDYRMDMRGRSTYGPRTWNTKHGTRTAKFLLSKSEDVPITLTVSSQRIVDNDTWPLVLDMMELHFHRLISLTLAISEELLGHFLGLEPVQFDCLKSISISNKHGHRVYPPSSVFRNAHHLRRIRIKIDMLYDWRANPLPWSQLTHITMLHRYSAHVVYDLLRACSALVFLHIMIGDFDKAILGTSTAPIHAPLLTTLKFMAKNIPEFLQPLVLPGLTHLKLLRPRFLYGQLVWNPAIAPLLCAAFPKLETLATQIPVPPNDIQLFLEHFPWLIELRVPRGAGIWESTLTSLADGSLAPRLEALRCQVELYTIGIHLTMLEGRRAAEGAASIVGTLLLNWATEWDGEDAFDTHKRRLMELRDTGHLIMPDVL